ncbi:hypothetical protein Zmor_017121 [Zophobas morio]|uniref:HhH-GPD domain-containing protein n=2 Tax=Zophobas morio TaxID=2755281 RepID=A0AA38IBW0_9CUCU|nr:hypothetical protein Zmor_017121 [Zophobas morio]
MMDTITLSPFFSQNTLLVAGICSRCYRDLDDVKIVKINTAFLRQIIKNRTLRWRPPRSPHNLVEESFYDNPWGLLVATIFLNKTTCFSARPLIEQFLEDFPDAVDVVAKKPEDLEKYFDNLGLVKRARQVWQMSYDFLYKRWRSVGELHGIGRYGEDAFRIFCLGDFSVEPEDRFLKIYRAWYLTKETEGERFLIKFIKIIIIKQS